MTPATGLSTRRQPSPALMPARVPDAASGPRPHHDPASPPPGPRLVIREPSGYASTELAPEYRSAAAARRFTRSHLTKWGMHDDLIADAALIATELVANAVNAVPDDAPALSVIIGIYARPS
jgi:hypothetical protein